MQISIFFYKDKPLSSYFGYTSKHIFAYIKFLNYLTFVAHLN
jgi:hypothetical protein